MAKNRDEFRMIHISMEKSSSFAGEVIGFKRGQPFFIARKREFLFCEPAQIGHSYEAGGPENRIHQFLGGFFSE